MPTSARQNAPFFTEICGEFVTSQWTDVGIGPYRALCRFAAAQRAAQGPASTNRI